MRTIEFIIDDVQYYRNCLTEDNVEPDVIDRICDNLRSFRCRYVLIGDKYPDKYELWDENGNKININNLNGYERGVVLADCDRYFEGRPLDSTTDMPTGCIKIKV